MSDPRTQSVRIVSVLLGVPRQTLRTWKSTFNHQSGPCDFLIRGKAAIDARAAIGTKAAAIRVNSGAMVAELVDIDIWKLPDVSPNSDAVVDEDADDDE